MVWILSWWSTNMQWVIIALVSFVSGWLFHSLLYLFGLFNRNKESGKEATNSVPQVKEEEKDAEESKMVVVVRTDLKMGKGKIAAQCCHAVVSLYDMIITEKDSHAAQWRTQLKNWERTGSKKVIAKIASEKEM